MTLCEGQRWLARAAVAATGACACRKGLQMQAYGSKQHPRDEEEYRKYWRGKAGFRYRMHHKHAEERLWKKSARKAGKKATEEES